MHDFSVLLQMAVCLCVMHLMCKLLTSDGGSLSCSLIGKIHAIIKKVGAKLT